jgi:hypothetical protein
MTTIINNRPERNLFRLAAHYKSMETKANPQAPFESGRVGIIDRLKSAQSAAETLVIVAEFKTFTQASDKTKRRFAKVLHAKCALMDEDQSVPREEIRQAAQYLKSAFKHVVEETQ